MVLLKWCPIEDSRISGYWRAFQLGSCDQPTQQTSPFMDLIRNSRGFYFIQLGRFTCINTPPFLIFGMIGSLILNYFSEVDPRTRTYDPSWKILVVTRAKL